MTTLKNIFLVILVVIVAVLGTLYLAGDNKTVGANAGPDSYVRNYFNRGITQGGVIATSTATGTYTPTARDFAGTPSVIEWQATGAVTLALGATSTFEYVPNVGDVASVIIHNASTTAAGGSSITFAAVDAQLDLQKNEDVADLACAVYDYCKLTFIRKSASTVTAIYDNYIQAD